MQVFYLRNYSPFSILIPRYGIFFSLAMNNDRFMKGAIDNKPVVIELRGKNQELAADLAEQYSSNRGSIHQQAIEQAVAYYRVIGFQSRNNSFSKASLFRAYIFPIEFSQPA